MKFRTTYKTIKNVIQIFKKWQSSIITYNINLIHKLFITFYLKYLTYFITNYTTKTLTEQQQKSTNIFNNSHFNRIFISFT